MTAKRMSPVLSLFLLLVLFCTLAHAEESLPGSQPLEVRKKSEAYISLFILGTNPRDKDLTAEGIPVTGTQLKSALGGGVKAGRFFDATRGVLGIEGEMFGHGGEVTAAPAFRNSTPTGTTFANANLTNINFMINLLARYPGATFQPYAGAGFGLSSSKISDLNLQVPTSSGTVRYSGKATDQAPAYQFLAGTRAFVSNRLFVFGEYKYFASNYSWGANGGGDIKLNFRTQIFSGGVGFTF